MAWLIYFDDYTLMMPEVFMGEGAEVAARARFRALGDNWSVTLFCSVDVIEEIQRKCGH